MHLIFFLIMAAAVIAWRHDHRTGYPLKSRNQHMRETLGDYVALQYNATLSDDYKIRYRGFKIEETNND